MDFFTRFYMAHSRPVKIAISISLVLVILFADINLLVLFINPRALRVDSLLYVGDDLSSRTRFTPQVVVALLSIILAAATVALVTRCVDEALWNHLTPSATVDRITAAESRNLALWSTSAAARIRYVFIGGSWALRICAVLLLAGAAVNPVLVSGISQTVDSTFETTFQPRDRNYNDFSGFLDDVNTWYASGTTRDLLGEAAFLTSLHSLNAPAAHVCNTSLCRANARMAGFQAICASDKIPNPDGIGLKPSSLKNARSQQFCSPKPGDRKVCVALESSDPETAAMFTNQRATESDGDFTTLFGAYVYNWYIAQEQRFIYTVDCTVRYGWVNVTQVGSNPPEVIRSSFQVVSKDELPRGAGYLSRIYGGDLLASSPWNFSGGAYGANGEKIVTHPIGVALLGWKETANGPKVARRIERAWDMNNIFAFGRSIDRIDLSTTIEKRVNKYVYNKLALFILIVPFLASILGIWNRWHVLSDELMLGYDPVRIVRCGPLYGVDPSTTGEELDKMVVARYIQSDMEGEQNYQFIAGGGDFVAELGRPKHG
ncbi:hypothetical protein MGYG_08859 [Nannizzia gypsea CBS 118893]|uniref:Uncharacterized protein n=1 Tax=Arthroderma gypseum (strain ATCC MYA-4604 / CBS 118893) TaxID=535722 RepID=E4V768_ARTGP|nr:hypothetical protein MGYG_08859 [Nannizzia gypsea CBS 118893]EFQ96934.1 hypothetical protein MGYG_08859 [Nannizzia gypsea CBS 118893]